MSSDYGSLRNADEGSDLKATVVLPSSEELLSASERSDLIDQAYDEYCERVNGGEEIDPEEFCARFPEIHTSVRKLILCHRKLEALPDLYQGLTIPWPAPGEQFLGFRLITELGRGAFARVFLAQEVSIGGRLIALKISMHDDHEADTLGRVEHTNVVPIYSTHHDQASGFSIVVMPFLGGTTLSHVIDQISARTTRPQSARALLNAARDNRWRPERSAAPAAAYRDGNFVDGVAYIGERLADALAHIHAQGVVHRDLKPSNVLLSPNGEPVLLDFNLALNQESHEYRLGGTLPYMPPEQLRALEKRQGLRDTTADVRTDLYGLGVILYELLTGEHPFGPVPAKLSTHEVRSFLIEKHRSGPRPLRSLNPDVDVRLATLIERSLAAEPRERPASAAEFCRTLRSRHSPVRKTVRWVAAHRRVLAAAAVAGIMLAGGATAYVATLPPAAQRSAQSGDEHAQAGRWNEAIAAYSRSLEDDPTQTSVRFARGRAYLQRHSDDDLHRALDDFRASDPDELDGRTLACRAFCHASLQHFESAITFGRQAIAAGYSNPAVLSNLAYSLASWGQQSEAAEIASQALTMDADHAGALMNRAVSRFALSRNGQPELAPLGFEDARRGLSRSMGSAKTYHVAAGLGARTLLLQGKQRDPAIENQVIEFTRKAIQAGYPRAALENCPLLGKWAKQFPIEVIELPSQVGNIDERLIDPMS